MFYDVWDPRTLLNITQTEAFNSNFEDMGISSLGFIDVLGSMPVLMLIMILGQILPPILMALLRKYFPNGKLYLRL